MYIHGQKNVSDFGKKEVMNECHICKSTQKYVPIPEKLNNIIIENHTSVHTVYAQQKFHFHTVSFILAN